MNEATQEVLKRLDALAAQLHTTGENLWNILIAQARVEAIKDFVTLGIASVITVGSVLGCLKCIRKCLNYDTLCDQWREGSQRSPKPEEPNFELALSIIFAVIGIGGFIFLLCTGMDWVTPWLNPQYWALEKVLQVLGK